MAGLDPHERTSIRRFGLALAALLPIFSSLGMSGCRDATQGASAPRPNVVLIVVDTLRPDFLGAYGFDGNTSPNLDGLAEKSIVFDRAIAASSLTVPSHASIMTSRYVREHSIGYLNGGTRLVDVETLASVFQAADYDTAAFVSNSVIRSRVGLDLGFDVYDDTLPDSERNRPFMFERTAERTTARAVEWLANRDPDGQPFFLWVHYQDPHGPYTPPAALAEQFDWKPEPGERPLPVLDRQNGRRGIPAYQALPGLVYLSQYRGRYAGEIRHFDAGLGLLLDAIEDSESDGGTIVLLTADHAESFGEGNYFMAHGHATTPDLCRIPFLLSAPGLAPGRNAELVHHVDVMPTLIDLAGLRVPEGLRGLALGRLLGGRAGFPSRVVYSDIGNDMSAYRRDDFVRVSARGEEANGKTGRWAGYRWSRNGRWSPAPIDEALRPQITAYLDDQTPTAPAAELDPADVERLRALGYVEP